MFSFDPRLLNDCEVLGRFKLCHVLLMRDKNYPWCILVPDREDKSEIFELSNEDQNQLQHESTLLLKYLSDEFNADKMNVAALGNVVSQLHVHHIVRYSKDIAWPAPVWGAHAALPYSDADLEKIMIRLIGGFERLELGFKKK